MRLIVSGFAHGHAATQVKVVSVDDFATAEISAYARAS